MLSFLSIIPAPYWSLLPKRLYVLQVPQHLKRLFKIKIIDNILKSVIHLELIHFLPTQWPKRQR